MRRKTNPGYRICSRWGYETDMGVLALHPHDQRPLGAAWIRLLIEEKENVLPLIRDGTPELAIAVLQTRLGKGSARSDETPLEAASQVYPAVMLSVS